jgi:hypothetical protein
MSNNFRNQDIKHYSTEELAELLLVKPQTIRAALCREGSYYGLMPVKLPNRRLIWSADAVNAMLAGKTL